IIDDILKTRESCVEHGDSAWAVRERLRCDELLGRYLDMWREKEPPATNNFLIQLTDRLQRTRLRAESPEPEAPEPEIKALPPAPPEVENNVDLPASQPEIIPPPPSEAEQIRREARRYGDLNKDWVEKLVKRSQGF